MKRIFLRIMLIILCFTFFSCNKTIDESSGLIDIEKSRTWKFYNTLQTEQLYITFEMTTADGTEARVAQAVHGETVTTIIDYEIMDDVYELHTPLNTYLLNVSEKEYLFSVDTGYNTLFSTFDYSIYEKANAVFTTTLDNASYLCEEFTSGENTIRFYFNHTDDVVFAIETRSKSETTQYMKNIKTSDKIPNEVIAELPDDYTEATFVINDEISWPFGWNN